MAYRLNGRWRAGVNALLAGRRKQWSLAASSLALLAGHPADLPAGELPLTALLCDPLATARDGTPGASCRPSTRLPLLASELARNLFAASCSPPATVP